MIIWTLLFSLFTIHLSAKIIEVNINALDGQLNIIRPSAILFYKKDDKNSSTVLYEFEAFDRMVSGSWMEITLFKVETDKESIIFQRWVIREVPTIKLVHQGRIYEYYGEKTAASLLKHMKEQIKKAVIYPSDEQKLSSLLNNEQTCLIYFADRDPSSMNPLLNSVANEWGERVPVVVSENIQRISTYPDFVAEFGNIYLFRKF